MNELFTRVSVRDFIPGKVEKDKVDRILEAAMNAPSARNQQAWEFIVVDDPDYIRELSKVTPYAGPVGKAPLAIVVLGNRDLMSAPQFWEQDLGACTENLMLSVSYEVPSNSDISRVTITRECVEGTGSPQIEYRSAKLESGI